MNKLRINTGVIVLLSSACFAITCEAGSSARGPEFTGLATAPSDLALVYFYRTAEKQGWKRRYKVQADSEHLVVLETGGYYVIELEPGEVVFSAHQKWRVGISPIEYAAAPRDDALLLTLEPGQIYFVKLFQETHFTHFTPHLIQVEETEALTELATCVELEGAESEK